MATPALFHPYGPFKVPVEEYHRSRRIKTRCPEFWDNNPELKDKCGVYVFAMKAGRGYTPIYVGKASKTFGQECFTSDKVSRHYSECLGTWAKGYPVMFFLATDKRRSASTEESIVELEVAMIRAGVKKNPELSNVHHKSGPSWEIRGVERGGRGKAPAAATEFKRAMSWKSAYAVAVA